MTLKRPFNCGSHRLKPHTPRLLLISSFGWEASFRGNPSAGAPRQMHSKPASIKGVNVQPRLHA